MNTFAEGRLKRCTVEQTRTICTHIS